MDGRVEAGPVAYADLTPPDAVEISMAQGPELRNVAYVCGPTGSVLDRLTVGYAGAAFDGLREALEDAVRPSRSSWVFRNERYRITVRFLAGAQDSSHEVAARLIEALHLSVGHTLSRRARTHLGLPGM